MALSIDLQYPHPNDTVGWAFSAGGTYDISGYLDNSRADTTTPSMQIGQVICRLLDSNSHVLDLQTFPVFSSPATGAWNVNFVETSNYDDCQVVAALSFFDTSNTPPPPDSASNIDVHGEDPMGDPSDPNNLPVLTSPSSVIVTPPFGPPKLDLTEDAEDEKKPRLRTEMNDVKVTTWDDVDQLVITSIRRPTKEVGSTACREVQSVTLNIKAGDGKKRHEWTTKIAHPCGDCKHTQFYRPVVRVRAYKGGVLFASVSAGHDRPKSTAKAHPKPIPHAKT